MTRCEWLILSALLGVVLVLVVKARETHYRLDNPEATLLHAKCVNNRGMNFDTISIGAGDTVTQANLYLDIEDPR